MKREKITVPVTLLNADVTQMSGKDRLKARSEGLFYITEGDQKQPFAAESRPRLPFRARKCTLDGAMH